MKTVAVISIITCIVSALIIVIDIIRHPQEMKIMNIVWPTTALYSGPLALLIYYNFNKSKKQAATNEQAFFQRGILKSTLHCGSGCTLGDLISSFILLLSPVTIFGSTLIGEWLIDYIAAFLFGIFFQYYAIKQMKRLPAANALTAALKADVLSLTFWQIGMYGWMAISNFLIFHHQLKADDPFFWLMMQLGMLCGLVTAYPVNWWLIKKHIKEPM